MEVLKTANSWISQYQKINQVQNYLLGQNSGLFFVEISWILQGQKILIFLTWTIFKGSNEKQMVKIRVFLLDSFRWSCDADY